MRIGILTGGGDVPGLNPCIKAVVNGADENGWDVVGIRRGWAGLLNFNPEHDSASEWIDPLDRKQVRTIDRYGGTHLHTSRTNPQKVRPADLPDFSSDSPTSGPTVEECVEEHREEPAKDTQDEAIAAVNHYFPND